jgi:hypothetical protein
LWDFDRPLDLEISPHVEILMTLHSSLFWNSQNHHENFLLTWRLERKIYPIKLNMRKASSLPFFHLSSIAFQGYEWCHMRSRHRTMMVWIMFWARVIFKVLLWILDTNLNIVSHIVSLVLNNSWPCH